jgi:methionine-rich copper-binding protein CopC
MRRTVLAPALVALATLVLPGVAQAHPKLVSASPAANAAVVKPTGIKLSFNEVVVGPLSGIDLTMTGMPGMSDHQPMPIKGFKVVAQGKDLTVALPRPLPAGSYELKWHAVAADQHRVEGSYAFSVK